MKNLFIITWMLLTISASSQEFFRTLPKKDALDKITQANFPGMDAVIILKEQCLNLAPSSVSYMGWSFSDLTRSTSVIKIVKILSEAGISRYGSFEYVYAERGGSEFPAGMMVRARVLKPSGEVVVVPEQEIRNIVSLANKNNTPVQRKVLMKIPNLEINDVVQIEYQHSEPFSTATSGFFYFNDRDYILFSNVQLTLPNKYEIDVYSFPEERIGKPTIEQLSKSYGSGETYFWSVRNCNAIPAEPFSMPLTDLSYMTSFVVKEVYHKDLSTWKNIVTNFYKYYVDRDDLKKSNYETLQIPYKKDSCSFAEVDTLYAKIKRTFELRGTNSIYPSDDIVDVFDEKQGDATDLTFIMHKILNQWKQKNELVLVRDKREGVIETLVPSLKWFDRLCVLVTINNQEKLYDFDEAIPVLYKSPWFLSGINAMVVSETGGYFKKFDFGSGSSQNQIIETHNIELVENSIIKDSVSMNYTGRFADNLRSQYYKEEKTQIAESFRADNIATLFAKIDTVVHNDFYENSRIEVGLSGKLKNVPEVLDSFIIFTCKEDLFSSFRRILSKSKRINDLYFDTPFCYTVNHKIRIPAGYEIKSIPAVEKFVGDFGSRFTMSVQDSVTFVQITGTLQVSKNQIAAEKYAALVQLIENSIKAVTKEVIFRKK